MVKSRNETAGLALRCAPPGEASPCDLTRAGRNLNTKKKGRGREPAAGCVWT